MVIIWCFGAQSDDTENRCVDQETWRLSVKVGDLVMWLDPWKVRRTGLVSAIIMTDRKEDYYDVLVDGKIEFCHRNNLEVISESR